MSFHIFTSLEIVLDCTKTKPVINLIAMKIARATLARVADKKSMGTIRKPNKKGVVSFFSPHKDDI